MVFSLFASIYKYLATLWRPTQTVTIECTPRKKTRKQN